MTHRDPVKAVPSWASIVSTIFPTAAGERDLHRLGREVSEHLRVGVEHAIAARARIGEDRFLDVHHREFVADPMGTVRARLRVPRLELTPSVEQAIADWHARRTAPARTGTHRYTAEQFGLSDAQLRSDYRLLHPTTSTSSSRADHHERATMTMTEPDAAAELGRPDAARSSASATT